MAARPIVSRARSPAVLQRPARERDLASPLQIAGRQRREQVLQAGPVGAEADDDEPRGWDPLEHQRPGRDQQIDALADDQLADKCDHPIAGQIETSQRARRRRVIAGERVAIARAWRSCRRMLAQPRGQRACARSRAVGLERGESLDVHPRGAAGACAAQANGRRAQPTGWRLCAASRRAGSARPQRLRGHMAGSARGRA